MAALITKGGAPAAVSSTPIADTQDDETLLAEALGTDDVAALTWFPGTFPVAIAAIVKLGFEITSRGPAWLERRLLADMTSSAVP